MRFVRRRWSSEVHKRRGWVVGKLLRFLFDFIVRVATATWPDSQRFINFIVILMHVFYVGLKNDVLASLSELQKQKKKEISSVKWSFLYRFDTHVSGCRITCNKTVPYYYRIFLLFFRCSCSSRLWALTLSGREHSFCIFFFFLHGTGTVEQLGGKIKWSIVINMSS